MEYHGLDRQSDITTKKSTTKFFHNESPTSNKNNSAIRKGFKSSYISLQSEKQPS